MEECIHKRMYIRRNIHIKRIYIKKYIWGNIYIEKYILRDIYMGKIQKIYTQKEYTYK